MYWSITQKYEIIETSDLKWLFQIWRLNSLTEFVLNTQSVGKFIDYCYCWQKHASQFFFAPVLCVWEPDSLAISCHLSTKHCITGSRGPKRIVGNKVVEFESGSSKQFNLWTPSSEYSCSLFICGTKFYRKRMNTASRTQQCFSGKMSLLSREYSENVLQQ